MRPHLSAFVICQNILISSIHVIAFNSHRQTLPNAINGKQLQTSPFLRSTTERVDFIETSDGLSASGINESVSIEDESTLTLKYQKHAEQISNSFKIVDFNPAKFSQNNHFQTISGSFLRNRAQCAYWDPNNPIETLKSILDTDNEQRMKDQGFDWYDKRERVETPDNDFFHVDYKYVEDRESRGTVIVVHGFESNSGSTLIIDMAKSFLAQGFDVACVNLRGCSGELNMQPGSYHLGFTDDLKYLLDLHYEKKMSCDESVKPIYLSAFSLGSNIVMKLLGELGTDAIDKYNIQGAAMLAVPSDLMKSSGMLYKPGINRSIYTAQFIKSMRKKMVKKYKDKYYESKNNGEIFLFDYEALIKASSVNEVEDIYIAPIYGFADHLDYYEKMSCGQFFHRICIPVLAINSKDDPFFHPEMEMPKVEPYNPIYFSNPDFGGHCGYMFHQDENDTHLPKPSFSWVSRELGRFIDHVDINKNL